MSDGRLLVIGDTLLDRDLEGSVTRHCPDAPEAPVLEELTSVSRPGGAGLAAALAAADGRAVTLVSALAGDLPGRELARELRAAGVELIDLGMRGATPQKLRLRSDGRTLLRLDRGVEQGALGSLGASARAAIGWADVVLVSDYGRGVAAMPAIRELLVRAAGAGRTIVWDPHPRGPAPTPGAMLVSPNQAEAGGEGDKLRARWRARHVCETRGAQGAALFGPRGRLDIPAPEQADGDSCGAGDRFAAAVAAALADGAQVTDAARHAVARASDFVAAGGASGWSRQAGARAGEAPAPAPAALELVELVRAGGGTVVATGGCFDLLHAGHVSTLEGARGLGHCLVVCLNSDASVARLKGPGRPLVGVEQRARVLRALACVDAVLVFEGDTPLAALEQLRPDVWVKGGDYDAGALPERSLVEGWGGRVVTLPYLEGHSTSRLLREAGIHG